MSEEQSVDFVAVARVARRVELQDIRLIALSAKLLSEEGESLSASIEKSKSTHLLNEGVLAVSCVYSFVVEAAETRIAEVGATYQIRYDVKGAEPVPEADLSQFASANGVYHSWPFLRQLVFDLTAKFGFPPYTLPVFLFKPEAKPVTSAKPPEPAIAPSSAAGPK